jgi:N-methylhydantoinase B
MIMPGGGGFGPVSERPPDLIKYDLDMGYITARGAIEDYGLNLDDG